MGNRLTIPFEKLFCWPENKIIESTLVHSICSDFDFEGHAKSVEHGKFVI